MLITEQPNETEARATAITAHPRVAESEFEGIFCGTGKCMVSGCGCPSYVDPPGGFDCKRCGHAKSEHW